MRSRNERAMQQQPHESASHHTSEQPLGSSRSLNNEIGEVRHSMGPTLKERQRPSGHGCDCIRSIGSDIAPRNLKFSDWGMAGRISIILAALSADFKLDSQFKALRPMCSTAVRMWRSQEHSPLTSSSVQEQPFSFWQFSTQTSVIRGWFISARYPMVSTSFGPILILVGYLAMTYLHQRYGVLIAQGIAVPLVFIMSHLSYQHFERRFLMLKERFEIVKSRPA